MTTAHPARRLAARSRALDALRALTISHRTASLAELERLALSGPARDGLMRRLEAAGLEAVLLATCNRAELYWHSHGADEDELAAAALRAAAGATPRERFARLEGRAAAMHLFRVACGLESLVIGEAEILGQVRSAIEIAERVGTAGLFLPVLFRSALRAGGQARSATAIGQGAMSVASAAVRTLARSGGGLGGATVAVVGAGLTGIKAARHLKSEHVGRLVLLNRTIERAREAAGDLQAEAAALETLPHWLECADAVLLAVDVESPLVTRESLAAAMAARSGRPLALVDLSLPRAADPECARVPGVTLIDLSSLEHAVASDRALREREVVRVEALLDRELAIFEVQARESAVRPLVTELRRRAEAIRRREVARALEAGPLDETAIQHLTRRIVDRLLHAPSEALRRDDLALDPQHARYLRLVFGLPAANGEDPHGHA